MKSERFLTLGPMDDDYAWEASGLIAKKIIMERGGELIEGRLPLSKLPPKFQLVIDMNALSKPFTVVTWVPRHPGFPASCRRGASE
jgi:hypothetical protein